MKKNQSDFRYNTGVAKVPWEAVGESYNTKDVLSVVEFLLQGSGAEYDGVLSEVGEALTRLERISSPPGKLSLGEHVAGLEKEVDALLKVENSLFVTNATAGFEIAFRYANLQPGDEVLIPAITFIATMAYPLASGAKVVFVDVDPVTLNMDPEDMARKITDKTKMVVPVHIGGYPVDMDPVMKLAEEHDIIVLEDAAHGFGGTYKGRPLGTIGHFGAFSFHEVKNITAFGEGGILVSSLPFRKELSKARFLGLDFSTAVADWLYDVKAIEGKNGLFVGQNSSTTEIQAVGLKNQLGRYEEILKERKDNALYLNRKFATCEAVQVQPVGADGSSPTYHLYLLQIDPEKAGGDMRELRKKLESKSVTTIPHFAPLYKFTIIEQLGYDREEITAGCPVAEDAFLHRFTHLPVYGLSREQLDYMAETVINSIAEMQAGK